MNDLRIDSMIEVPVEYLDSDYKKLLKALTVPNPEYRNSKFFAKGFGKKSIPANLHFFELDELSRVIYIPRNISDKLFNKNIYNIIYNNTIKETILPQVISAEPRDYQQKFLDNKVYPVLNKLKNNIFSDILINAGCGAGKTFLSLKIAQYYGVKTLVCVTQTKIGNQFLDTCRDLFPGWTCGWEDGKSEYDITVATYSLLSGDNYTKDYFGKFGHYIYDEYHRCGAVTYMEVLRKSVGRKRTSLTATPRRKDGLYKILQLHAGEVITMDRQDMQAKIYPITTGSDLEEWKYRNVTRNSTKPENVEPYSEVCLKHMTGRHEVDRGMIISMDKDAQQFTLKSFNTRTDVIYSYQEVSIHILGIVSTATMDTDISMKTGRNNLVMSVVRKLRSEGRRIVLLSKRKDQLFMLERMFKKRGIKCGVVVSDKDANYKEHCKKMGKTTKEYSKWVFEEADVLLGIDKLAEEGMDAPRYDTLIYLHSIKDIEQSIGRVLREKPGKPQPIAVYLIDKVSVYYNAFYGKNGAQKQFKELGHEMQNELSLAKFEQLNTL